MSSDKMLHKRNFMCTNCHTEFYKLEGTLAMVEIMVPTHLMKEQSEEGYIPVVNNIRKVRGSEFGSEHRVLDRVECFLIPLHRSFTQKFKSAFLYKFSCHSSSHAHLLASLALQLFRQFTLAVSWLPACQTLQIFTPPTGFVLVKRMCISWLPNVDKLVALTAIVSAVQILKLQLC